MIAEQMLVRRFHEVFGATVNKEPTMPSAKDMLVRYKLIAEELDELAQGFKKNDIVEVADALGDLLYVTLGTAVCCGLDLGQIFHEVHRSNMTKLWTLDEVQAPGAIENGTIVNAVMNVNPDSERHVRAFSVKRADGKILKSPSYSPANPENFFP